MKNTSFAPSLPKSPLSVFLDAVAAYQPDLSAVAEIFATGGLNIFSILPELIMKGIQVTAQKMLGNPAMQAEGTDLHRVHVYH